MSTVIERGEGGARPDREARIEERASIGDRRAVGAGVGDDDQDEGLVGVALLAGHAAQQRLKVADPGLDREMVADATELGQPGVPRSQVVSDRSGDLRPEAHRVGESSPDAFEEPNLAGVAEGIRTRKRAQPDVEPADGAQPGKSLEIDAWSIPSLDPKDVGG